MTKWFTEDNTEGFTGTDLDAMNTAYAAIMRTVSDDFETDTHAVSDALNNAWFEGATADDLIAIVGTRFA